MSSKKTIAIVPMRAGSSLTDKNIRSFYGMPLFYWTVKKLLMLKEEGLIDTIIVSTDSSVYTSLVFQHFSHHVITDARPKSLGTKDTSTEDVTIDYLKRMDITQGNLLIAEVTSPLIPLHCHRDILDYLQKVGISSAFAVASDYSQWWVKHKGTLIKNRLQSLYDERKMRQDNDEPLYREVGLWGVDIEEFLKIQNRIVEPHMSVIIDSDFGISIDNEKDLMLAEWLMKFKHAKVFT